MLKKLVGSGEWFGDLGKLALRVVFAGGMLLGHGIPKIQSWSERAATFPDPMGVGHEVSLGLVIFAECFAAGLVLIGGLTRLALLPLIINMAVAVFVIHGADAYSVKELAVVYLAAYTALFFVGPGRISVDAALLKN
jgi:putative oxidoreductase